MSPCATYRPLVGSRPGELEPALEAELRQHLAGCADCRRFADGVAATEGLLAEALGAAAARRDFAPFVDGVMARIEATRPLPWLGRLRRLARLHPRWVVGGALAPLVVAAAVALVLRVGSGGELADLQSLELNSEGTTTTVIQSSDGPVILLDDDDNES